MEKVKHILLIIALFFIAVILNLSLKEIKGKKSKVFSSDIEIKTDASALLNGVVYTKTVKDFTEFMISAKSTEYFKSDGRSIFDDIHAKFYSQTGNEYRLTGDTGTYDTIDDTISIAGDVTLISDDGYELITDTLYYSYDDKTLTTEDAVSVKKGNISIEGIGMVLDLMDEKINIHKKVRGHVKDS
jgi:LPS export ABC transporter protein LptC